MPPVFRRQPLPKPAPESDPRHRRVIDQIQTGAKRVRHHGTAAQKAGAAAAAAKGPPTERLAAGKAKQVEKIQQAKEQKTEPASFLLLLRAELMRTMPTNLGEAENFEATAKQVKGGLKANVAEQKERSTGEVAGASKQTPSAAGEAKLATALPKDAAVPALSLGAAESMPAPKSASDVSLQDSKQHVEASLREARVTSPQLRKANDPRFSAVLDSSSEVGRNADAGPAKYRARELAVLAIAAAKATTASRTGTAAMLGVRTGANARVLDRQQQQRARDEAKRKEVVERIESIYGATKARVETKLEALDGEVNGIFDRGVDAALAAMTSFVNDRLYDYKLRRYLSVPLLGLAAWVRDQWQGLPAEVSVFYERGRTLFQALMDTLIVRVASLVELRLKEAKAEVAKGQAEIKAFVGAQPKDLALLARQAEADVGARFAELESGVDDKKNQLASSLAQKYKEGFEQANASLQAIQDENRGLVQKFVEKLGAVIQAIREFKAKLQGILRKGEDTLQLIIEDPIGFLGNLIGAVKGGIQAFADNIWSHLESAFVQWLAGNLPPGVEIPSDLSPGSILKLVLGVLGITYDSMRTKAVRLVGERNVSILEKVVDYVRRLITGGPAALWEQVKDDLASLKAMVVDAIKDWLITAVIKSAVAKIASMFNPVGAIIQAILAIYNLVAFVVERAAQILAFVESVINSVHAIATGDVSAAVKKVEGALARALPLVISFLARLLNLGGITERIRELVARVRGKVDAAIDKAIARIVKFVKGLKSGAPKAAAGDPAVPEATGDIVERVKAAVSSRLTKPITTADELRSVFDAVSVQFGPDQLRSLTVVPIPGKAKKFWVEAKVNPIFRASELELRLQSFVVGDLQFEQRTTRLISRINGEFFRRVESDPGEKHAEELLLDELETVWDKTVAHTAEGERPHLEIDITRSPCPACAALLKNFVVAKKARLTLRAASVYSGPYVKDDPEKLQKQRAEAKAALKDLAEDPNITIGALDVLAEFTQSEMERLHPDSRKKLEQYLYYVRKALMEIRTARRG